MADTGSTDVSYPSQPYIYMGLLVVGVVAAMTMEFKGVSLNLYMLMYAMSGLIGTLMASFSQNVGPTRPVYTMQAFGWPFIVTVGVTILMFVIAWLLARKISTQTT